MSEYFPDRWVVIEVSSEGETLRRVLGSWWGGFGGITARAREAMLLRRG